MNYLTLNLSPVIKLDHDKFYQLCQNNGDLRLELLANGEVIIMPPTGGETGRINSKLVVQLGLWNEQSQLGEVFDSSTGFVLPNKAIRSPDVAWLEKSRWQRLTKTQQQKFIPLCPNFVIELLSPTDILTTTQNKMREYLDNGCRLAWLINPQRKEVEIYQPNQPVNKLTSPQTISGEYVLPEFTLDLRKIW